jgi:CMP-N,N'-diacetyllegionaminic acid synthase
MKIKILALITARAGSKRLPGKNIRPLNGMPLIVWSINVVKDISEVCDILVSTDDTIIAELGLNSGALVPWLRPSELASDTASSVDVALHALNWYERENGKVDGLMLLQPTSPFRKQESILRGIEIFKKNKKSPVIGVSLAESHPMWCFKLDGDLMEPFIEGGLHLRSQDLPAAYIVNGAFYLIAPEDLRNSHSFFNKGMRPLIMDHIKEGIDIDTEWDWQKAEALIN